MTARATSLAAGMMLLFALPWLIGIYSLHVVTLVLISVISAIGLYFVTGLTGQISLCHATFSGIAAYVMVLLGQNLGVPFWISWPAGAVLAAGIGVLVGIPALRLQGHYLALATLGLGEIALLANVNWESLTNGPNGINVPAPVLGSWVLSSERDKYLLVVITVIAMVLLANNLRRSRFGLMMTAIMDSEIAAQASGVRLARYKVFAFALSAFYAGISGGLYAVVAGFITPYEFGLWPSLWTLTMVVVGGMGYLPGAILGAVMITALPELLRGLRDYQELIYGALLLVTLIYNPGGLYGLVMKVRAKIGRRDSSRPPP